MAVQIIIEDQPYDDGCVGKRVKINTLCKNYNLKELTSTSQTLSAEVSLKPVPHGTIEIE